jgi:O-antigen/teichoic acid export membrane protein
MIEVRPAADGSPPSPPADAVAPATPTAPGTGRSLVARNISLLSLGQLVTWAGTLVWTVIVPRRLGSSEIGILTLGTAVSGILGVVVGLGLPPLLVREIAADPRRAPRLVGTAIVLRAVLLAPALAGTLLLAFLGPFRGEEAVALILGWGLCATAVVSSPVAAGLQAMEKMNYLAYGAILSGTLGTVSGIVMVMVGIRAIGLLLSSVVIGALFTGVFLLWARPFFHIDWRVSWRDLRQLMIDSLPYWSFAAFFTIYLWIDSLMLGFMTSSTVLGWYGLPTRLFSTLMAVPVILSNATLPRLVRAHKRGDEDLLRTARPVMEMVVLLSMPICVGSVLVASPLLRAIYGPGFAGSIPVFALLALCVPPMYLNIMANQIMIARKQQMVWTKMMVLASVINPLMNLFLIPYFQRTQGNGAIGASVAMVITEVVLAVIGLWLVRGAYVRKSAVRMFKGAIATAVMGIIVVLALRVGLLLGVVAGMASFAAAALLLRLATDDELEQGKLLLVGVAGSLGLAALRASHRARRKATTPRD